MKKFVIIISLIVLVCSLTACGVNIGFDSSVTYANADKYSIGNTEIKDKVEKLEIEWINGSVDVVTSEGDAVSIVEEAAEELSDDMRVHWWLEGTTLHIKYSAANVGFHFSITEWKKYSKALTVSLPSSFDLSDVSVGTASADVTVSDINADNIDVDTASGKVDVTGEAEKINIDTASGNIMLNSSGDASNIDVGSASGNVNLTVSNVEKAKIDTASGSVTCVFKKTPEKCDIDTASGEVYITLPEDAAFTLNFDTASGAFKSDFAYKMSGREYICGSGSAEFNIDTASGDITISIQPPAILRYQWEIVNLMCQRGTIPFDNHEMKHL